ncbi:MAG: LLM class flavin-dependent oxidoreductase [Natronomonas sp.]
MVELDFGIFTMPEHPPWENWNLSYDRDVQEAKLADELGFDEYWIGEHHTGSYENVPVPEYMIAKISAETEHINLGPGTVNLPYHDPFLVAERLAFLDQLTDGRVIYGYGGGGLPSDMEMFSIDGEDQREMIAEAIDIIQTYTQAEEPTSYDGEFWSYDDRIIQVPPYQDEPMESIAGLTRERSYEMAGEMGMGSLSVYFTPLETPNNPAAPNLQDHARAMTEAAEAAGRDPQEVRDNWGIVREVYVSDSKEQALDEIREGVEDSYSYLIELGLGALMKRDDEMPDDDLSLEWMAENIPWIIGSPEDCIRQIKKLHEEVGGFGTLILNSRDWVTTDLQERSLELFAREVMPAFQSNKGPREWHKQDVGYASPEPDENVFQIEPSSSPTSAPADDDD